MLGLQIWLMVQIELPAADGNAADAMETDDGDPSQEAGPSNLAQDEQQVQYSFTDTTRATLG